MTSAVAEVHWFPRTTDRFVTWGPDINIYQVKNFDNVDHTITSNISLDLSSNSTAVLLASEIRYQYIRCVAPSYQAGPDLQLAVGLANGKVAICNFVALTENNIEYTPRQSRPVLCLAWNENDTNLLAMGHDRNRSDHCITIWDTERGAPKDSSILHLIGLSDTANSLCWDKHHRVLLAGVSHKWIKMIDIRQSTPAGPVTSTRSVYGLSVAPNGRYMASYHENFVGLWDIRNIDKPISTLTMQKAISKLTWCPTRSSVLGTLQRDSSFVHLLDLHWPGTDLDGEPHSIKRNVTPFSTRPGPSSRHVSIGDISWHPTDLERMLALSGSSTICDFKVPQRIAISWDNNNMLWGSEGARLSRLPGSPSPPSSPTDSSAVWDRPVGSAESTVTSDDIAEIIRRRALNDYGQMTDIQKNGDLAQNPGLRSVWHLLAHMSREDCMLGLKAILEIKNENETTTMPRSDFNNMTWSDFPASGSVKVYNSTQREFSQILCGWNYERHRDNSFTAFIDELCTAKHEYTRAAMLACFHLKIRCAIETLGRWAEKSADPNGMRMAAIALSGFNQDKSGIWSSQCAAAQSQISDPHLKAMFAFLTPADNENYRTVLSEKGVSLCDRMAFACMFLSDSKLAEYVRDMIKLCIDTGDLDGLLLTGATPEGIALLQSHLDFTEDVQTVALIAARFLTPELIGDFRVQYWISSYRDLLDTWGLWEQRALLDITIGNMRSPPRTSRSIYLQCNFCCKSVSAALQEESRVRSNAPNVNKLSSCPHCRKPLPRCSLCLLHMGTITGLPTNNPGSGHASGGWQSRPFSKWFSWCQTCRHGGHTEHMAEWFKEHPECPVTSCTCKCFAMDLPMAVFPREIS